jgi:SAM-dependent methyltransferase
MSRSVADPAGLAVRTVAGRGEELPFADGAFDLVLFAETLEHLDRPRATGREIVRVLRPGGLCYITTPARLRFLFAREPHYAIPGLLLLPDGLQRWLFERVLRPGERYGVTHTFWSVPGVLRTLPGMELAEVTSKNWAGPLRRLDWDWIVARKRGR